MYSIKKDNKIKKRAENWQKEKKYLNLQQDIQHEREQIKNKYKAQKRALTTTKFLMFFLFISCSVIELFTIYIILKAINMGLEVDFTPLTMLITAIVAQVIGFAVYSLKSTKENIKGGIIYEMAMQKQCQNNDEQQENFNEEEIQG